jgi:hypothetical protein
MIANFNAIFAIVISYRTLRNGSKGKDMRIKVTTMEVKSKVQSETDNY